MIIVYTGKPGAGKTLNALVELVARARKEPDRPVYVSGVRGLKVDHKDLAGLNIQDLEEPEDWQSCPDGSLIFIDEAQRIFRPRRSGSKVPGYQAALETHRHRGIDFVFTTQGAHLLDAHIYPLVEVHVHLHRGSAREGCWRYEWSELEKLPRGQTAKERAQSVRPLAFKKGAYDWYSSAEIHTHKWRMPWRLLFKLSIPLLFLGTSVYFGLQSDLVRGWFGMEAVASSPDSASDMSSDPISQDEFSRRDPARSAAARVDDRKIDDISWSELFSPEVEGKPWTAPVYRRAILEGGSFPTPRCVAIHGADGDIVDCRCYSDQATRLDVGAAACRQIAFNGWFDPTRRAGGQAPAGARPRAAFDSSEDFAL